MLLFLFFIVLIIAALLSYLSNRTGRAVLSVARRASCTALFKTVIIVYQLHISRYCCDTEMIVTHGWPLPTQVQVLLNLLKLTKALLRYTVIYLSGYDDPNYTGHKRKIRKPFVALAESTHLRILYSYTDRSLTGQVLLGPLAGCLLSALSFSDLWYLHQYYRHFKDKESLNLLEMWLDYQDPVRWRKEFAKVENRSGSVCKGFNAVRNQQRKSSNTSQVNLSQNGYYSSAKMTHEEALQILGVASTATSEQIHVAYRRLMSYLHPDRGGSNYLAAQINMAKDILLNSR